MEIEQFMVDVIRNIRWACSQNFVNAPSYIEFDLAVGSGGSRVKFTVFVRPGAFVGQLKEDQRRARESGEFAASADLGAGPQGAANSGAEQASAAKRGSSERSEDVAPVNLPLSAGVVCDCGAKPSPIAGETHCWWCGKEFRL